MKKSQATIFIIVGIVILLIVGLFFSMSEINKYSVFGPPGKIKPVVTYTETCIQNVAEQGALTQKMQGGFIELPPKLQRTNGYVESGFNVPYWYHDRVGYMPTRYTMEEDLAKYIDQNIKSCLNFNEAFNKYKISANQSSTDVTIENDKIRINTNMPTRVELKGEEKVFNWDNFKVRVNDKLGKLHSLARDIMEHENSEAFLEGYTDEMIASSDYLPFEGMFIECSPQVYLQRKLKEYTQTLIMHNLNYLQFENTDYTETGMPYYDKLYKVDAADGNFKDLQVKTMYNPEWGMDFKAIPSENGVVKSMNFKARNFMQTCIQMYHHRYNVKYPVMFRISDKEGEAFHFATPVIMKRNQPNRKGRVEPWESEIEDRDARNYCKESENITSYKLKDNNIVTESTTLDNRQNELRVFAVNPLYGWPEGAIPGVNISYQCIEAKCDMGTTELPTYDGLKMPGGIPRLKTDFPSCVNGLLIAEKDGYHTATKKQTVDSSTSGEQVNIDMYELKDFDYDVRVVQEHNGIINERPLRDNESVIITLKNRTHNFEKTIVYPSEEGYLHNLSLMKGKFTYELEVMLTWKNSLVGGTEINWTPKVSKILNNDRVMFYVYKKDPATPPSSRQDLYKIYEESLEKSVDYPPRFT